MHDTPTTRRSLLFRLRDSQDAHAWSEFVEIYEPLVYRLARGKGFQHADAADLTQDVLAAVAGAIERFDPDRSQGTFRGWLFRITRNLMVNAIAQRQRRPQSSGDTQFARRLEEVPERDGGEVALFEQEYRRELFRWAAERVRPEFRESSWQAFWRTSVDGEAVRQVAAELKLTEGAVYVARSRVMARLRAVIEQADGTQ